MVNRCENCGGLLNFDISEQKLKCENCDSLFIPEEYSDRTGAKENPNAKEYSVSVFTCPNCGGSISSNEAEAAEYCLYCGSFVTLTSQVEKVQKPHFIMPFTKTKEDCVKSYSKMIGHKLYAPKEFRNKEFLSGFKGIYIPYWTYGYEYGPNVTLKSVEETRSGDYIHKQEYIINCKAQGELDGLSYDASSSFDDEISSRITPFDTKKLKPFRTPYMFGFFADTADIPADIYQEDATALARDQIWDTVAKDPKVKDNNPERPDKDDTFDKNFNVKERSYLSMLPVWFLTWRNKDRVAYSVVNGESGNIYSEVPVDIKRYLLFSFIFAIPIFMLLNVLITFNASDMLKISAVLSLLMTILYSAQLEKIVRKLFHADDRGYLSVNIKERKKAEAVTENVFLTVVMGIWLFLKDDIWSLGFWGLLGTVAIIFAVFEYIVIGLVIVVIISIIYFFFRIGKNSKLLKDKSVWGDVMGAFVSMILSALMLIVDPAGDMFYYVMALICVAGVVLTAILTMKRYNELVTRPLPHFFDRKKGGEA